MLSAVKEIGKLIIQREGSGLLEILVEDPNANGNYKKVLTILMEQDQGKIKFVRVELEDYDSQKKLKYLYRSGAANGADLTPTAKLGPDPEGTFDRKILGWFSILDDKKSNFSPENKAFLSNLRKELEDNSKVIKSDILRLRASIPKKESLFITLKIKQDKEYKYVGDFDVFRETLISQVNKKDQQCAAEDKVCSICGERKPIVFGNLDTYAFYTLDKPGYITGGFEREKSWRNFPVCSECKLALEEGKKFIEKNLTFRFCGLKYNLIPKFIIGTNGVPEDILDVFTSSSKLISLKQKTIDSITGDEEEILFYLKDLKDVITLNLLFIQKMNAAERILLHIEDVFPSRLNEIFKAKHKVDEIFRSSFNFRTIRKFFDKSDPNKRNYDLDEYFLDIADRVFKGRPIDYYFVLRFIMRKVRTEFVNDGYFNFAVNDGLQTIAFLQILKMVKMEERAMEERVFDVLFKKYGLTFETPVKRGLFLLGSLTELLLRKQYKERGAKPFAKNLKSLRMSEGDFKGLLPKIQTKLEEYDSFDKGKRLLAAEASNYLLTAGDGWKMPVDELNFYFAAGMNLVEEVAEIIYPNKGMADLDLKNDNNDEEDV